MKVHEHLDAASSGRATRPEGWRTSGRRPSGLGLGAWALAVAVVALFAVALYLMYQ